MNRKNLLVLLGAGLLLALLACLFEPAAERGRATEPTRRAPKPKPARERVELTESSALATPAVEAVAKPAKKPSAPPSDAKQGDEKVDEPDKAGLKGEWGKKKAAWAGKKGDWGKKSGGKGDWRDTAAGRAKLEKFREAGWFLELSERRLVGRLVDEQARGVPGARIEIAMGPKGAGEPTETISDEDGRFELSAARYRYRVRIEAPGSLEDLDFFVPWSEQDPIDLGELVLRSTEGLVGVVVDPAGEAVAGARVRLVEAAQFAREQGAENVAYVSVPRLDVATATTGPSGRFEIKAAVAAGNLLLAEAAGARPSAPVVVGSGPLQLSLREARSLQLRVTDQDGRPIADARALLTRWGELYQAQEAGEADGRAWLGDVRTDPAGLATFTGLPFTRYQVIVDIPGYAPKRENVALSEDRDPTELRLTVELGSKLRARLVSSSDGRALSGSVVLCVEGEDGRPDMQRLVGKRGVAEDGVFGFERLEAGRYVAILQAGDHASSNHAFEVDGSSEVDLGDVPLQSLGEVAITVLDAQGAPLEGLRLSYSGTSADALVDVPEASDATGRLSAVVPRARVTLALRAGDAVRGFEAADFSSSDSLTLRLPAADARVSGRVLDPSGAPRSDLRVEARWSGGPALTLRSEAPDDQGRFEITGLPPGRYDLLLFPVTTVMPSFFAGQLSTTPPVASVTLAQGDDKQLDLEAPTSSD